MSVYNNPTLAKINKLKAELRFEVDKARIERRWAYIWGFGAGVLVTLALDMLLSL